MFGVAGPPSVFVFLFLFLVMAGGGLGKMSGEMRTKKIDKQCNLPLF